MNKSAVLFLACGAFLLSGCDDDADTITATRQPAPMESVTPLEPLAPLDNINPTDDLADEVVTNDIMTPDEFTEARVLYFLDQSIDVQSQLAFELEDSAENIELATRLMRENISAEVKIDLLSSLEYAETPSILPLLRVAIQDASAEVVVAALRILYQHATQDDLPQLQLLAGASPDDEVREAAQDVIDALEP